MGTRRLVVSKSGAKVPQPALRNSTLKEQLVALGRTITDDAWREDLKKHPSLGGMLVNFSLMAFLTGLCYLDDSLGSNNDWGGTTGRSSADLTTAPIHQVVNHASASITARPLVAAGGAGADHVRADIVGQRLQAEAVP